MSASSSSVTSAQASSTPRRIVCFTPPCGAARWLATQPGDATPLLHLSTCSTCKEPTNLVFILLEIAAQLEAQEIASTTVTDNVAIANASVDLFNRVSVEYKKLCDKTFANVSKVLDPAVRARGQTSRADASYLKSCANVLDANISVYLDVMKEIEAVVKSVLQRIDGGVLQAIDLHAINLVAALRPKAQPSLARAQGDSGKMVKVRPFVFDYGVPPSSTMPFCCVFNDNDNASTTLAGQVAFRLVCELFVSLLPLQGIDLRLNPAKAKLIDLEERLVEEKKEKKKTGPSITSTGIIDPHVSEATQKTLDTVLKCLWKWFGDFRAACIDLNCQVLRYIAAKTNGAALLRAAERYESTFPYSEAKCDKEARVALNHQKDACNVLKRARKLIAALKATKKDDAAILRIIDNDVMRDIYAFVPSNVIWLPKCDGVLTYPVVLGPIDIPYTIDLSMTLHGLFAGPAEADDTIDTRRKRVLVRHLKGAIDDARGRLITRAETEVKKAESEHKTYSAKAHALALAEAQSEARACDASRARFAGARTDSALDDAKAAALAPSSIAERQSRIQKQLMHKAIQARLDEFTWKDFNEEVDALFKPLAYANLEARIERLRKAAGRAQASLPARSLEAVLDADERLTELARTYIGTNNMDEAKDTNRAFLMHRTNNFIWHAVTLDGKQTKTSKNKGEEGVSRHQSRFQLSAACDNPPNLRINFPFAMFRLGQPHAVVAGKIFPELQKILASIETRPKELVITYDEDA